MAKDYKHGKVNNCYTITTPNLEHYKILGVTWTKQYKDRNSNYHSYAMARDSFPGHTGHRRGREQDTRAQKARTVSQQPCTRLGGLHTYREVKRIWLINLNLHFLYMLKCKNTKG
jgi:hypothetical protein